MSRVGNNLYFTIFVTELHSMRGDSILVKLFCAYCFYHVAGLSEIIGRPGVTCTNDSVLLSC